MIKGDSRMQNALHWFAATLIFAAAQCQSVLRGRTLDRLSRPGRFE